MARTRPDPTPEQAFLAPLARLAARMPEMEVLVFWANPAFDADPTEDMDAGEVAFYAEGLMAEGFHLEWRIIGKAADAAPDHIRLYVSEAGTAPPAETAGAVLSSGGWPV